MYDVYITFFSNLLEKKHFTIEELMELDDLLLQLKEEYHSDIQGVHIIQQKIKKRGEINGN